MAFQFGSGTSASGGFTFGPKSTATATSGSSLFSQGGFSSSLGTGGFSFGSNTAPSSAQPTAPFSIGSGSGTFPAATVSGGFSFGSGTSAPGFSFGSAPTVKPSSSIVPPLFSLSSSAPQAPAGSSGLSVTESKSQSSSLFSLGSIAPSTTSGFSFGGSLPLTLSTSTYSLTSTGVSTQPTVPFSLTAPSVVTQVSSGPASSASSGAPSAFGIAATSAAPAFSLGGFTAAKPGFSFGSVPAGATSMSSQAPASVAPANLPIGTAFKLNAPSVAATTTALVSDSTSTLSLSMPASSIMASSVTSSVPSVAPSLKTMSYKELEDVVGRWLQDLSEQENAFLRQAGQVNIWDKQLMENGEQITELHYEVERVKAEQQRLDRELDFILSQQQELEELLVPIETQLRLQETMQYSQHADVEREKTYKLAESIDCQLKHMMQDLREIIDYINNSNLQQGKSADEPMVQIAKILNAHMDSLQWIDQNANVLQRRVDDVTRLMETRHRDYDRTFHLSGYD